MSLSELVDAGYRIDYADLQGQELVRKISNVSYQGLEELSPVLHLEGLNKRLVLDARQSKELMALTHTSIPEEWIGATIRIAPAVQADTTTIRILPAQTPTAHKKTVHAYLLFALIALSLLMAAVLIVQITNQLPF